MIENKSKEKLIVGLCDDEQDIHTTVQFLMDAYAQKNGLQVEMVHFYSTSELLQYKQELSLLLLDIDMPEMDGIAAAGHLNAREVAYKIVMLTVKTERFKEAFKIGAFRFVTKPVVVEELYEAVDSARECMIGMKTIEMFQGGISYTFLQRDIDYIRSERDITLLFIKGYEFCSDNSMIQWLDELDERMFFRSHKSYIVNLGRIKQIGQEEAILLSGERIPVSRRNRTPLLKAFMVYDTKRG